MKKIFKYLILLLSFIFFEFFISVDFVLADDFTVTCYEEGPCEMVEEGEELFYETNWLPGDTVTRTITFINEDPNYDCPLILEVVDSTQDPGDFATKLLTEIKDRDTGTILYGGDSNTLDDLYQAGPVSLDNIPANGAKYFDWTVTFDSLAGNDYQLAETVFDFDLVFECGQAPSCPELLIDKTNDKKGLVLGQGDVVNYTITVVNNGPDTALNVQVEDVQPVADYFDYQEGSGWLTCTDGTDTALTASGTNPYFWNLGDLDNGESCTLTYQLEIVSTDISGTHYNIALAISDDGLGGNCFSDPVLDPFDVGQPGEVSGSYSGEIEVEQSGSVLGAAVAAGKEKAGEVLGAATGSKTLWLVLSLVMILVGSLLKLGKKGKKIFKLLKSLFLALLFLSLNVSLVLAVDDQPPVVKIVQLPEYLNKRDFQISYTALDGGEAGLKKVKLEYKKDGGGWENLGSYSDHSKKVKLDSSKIDSQTKYYFKATACDNNDNCQSDQTSTTVDWTAPPKPENYSKEKIGSQSYKVKWHNPDSDDLDKVYIYRSDKKDFAADDSTEVARIDVSKNSDNSWTDSVVPQADKDYYYALRSVDKAGNASDLVGDTYNTYLVSETVSQAPAGEEVTGQETMAGQQLTTQQLPPAGAGETTEGQVLGQEKEEATQPAQKAEAEVLGEEKKEPAFTEFPWGILVIGCLGLIFIIWRYWKKEE